MMKMAVIPFVTWHTLPSSLAVPLGEITCFLDYSEVVLFRHFISNENVTEILHIDIWSGCPFRFLPPGLALSILNISHQQTISIVLRCPPGHFSCLAAGLCTPSSLVVPNSGL